MRLYWIGTVQNSCILEAARRQRFWLTPIGYSFYLSEKSNALAKTNFQYEKRQKDLEKKRKKEEKLKKKADKSSQPEGTPDESGGEPGTGDGTDTGQTGQATEAGDVEAIPGPATRSNDPVE